MSKVLATPKISVIVPIYNVEKYIEKSLDSLKNQTLKDIEFILVNDGSTDNSISIAQKYLKDNRFSLYHKENGGLSSARNFGMKYAKGQYLAFIDSDDYIEPTMYEKMYNLAIDENSDVVECDFIWEYDDHIKVDKTLINNDNLFIDIRVVAWNKIYRKTLIDNLKLEFTNGVRYEDVDWCYKILPYINKFSSLKEPMYHYIQRNSSIANTQNEKVKDIFIVLENIIDYYKKNKLYEKHKSELEYLFLRITLGSSFLRITGIKDKKVRNNILIQNWKFLNEKFPSWKKNKILKSRYDKKNIYYKMINKSLYLVSAKIVCLVRR